MIKNLNKIRVQISLYYAVIALISIILIGVSLFYLFSNILIEQSLNSVKSSIENSGKYIESYIEKIYGISSLMSNDQKLINYIKNNDEMYRADILSDIENIITYDKFIQSIIIVTYDGRLISNDKNITIDMSSDMMEKSWYTKATKAMPYLSSTRMNEFTSSTDAWVISISREITDENGKNLGVMLIDVDYRFVEEHLLSMEIKENSEVFILDNSDCLVYHKDTSYFSNHEKTECLALTMLDTEEFNKETNTLTYQYTIQNADWTLASVTELTELNALRKDVITDIIVVGSIVIILILIASNFFAKRITTPIKKLEEAMSGDENNKVVINKKDIYCDEVKSLTLNYNDMIDRINNLIEENVEKERKVRDSEIAALTSQINPHFLYNTLDTILWMAEYKDTEGVVAMIKALGQFFRLSLSRGATMVPIKDEIQHVKEYLTIQKIRYGDKLNYSFDLDESIMEFKVPKIILQPIVENAIYHGIKELDGNGHISIKSTHDEDHIYFIIKDNGVGFNPNDIEKPKDKLRLSGVGIKNIDERLKLHYCEKCGVTIESEVGVGTTATLKINNSLSKAPPSV